MPESPGVESDWVDAIRQAARRLPSREPDARIFYECREDTRVDLPPGATAAVVRTRTTGLRIERPGRGRALFLAEPAPIDIKKLLDRGPRWPAATAGDGNGPRRTTAFDARPGTVAKILESTRASLRPLEGTRPVLAARWVAFRQRVWVGLPGGEVRTDLRAGSHLRVEIVVGGESGERSRLVGERVLRAGAEVEDLGPWVEALAERAGGRGEVRAPRAGPTAVVFAPGVAGVLLHETVGHALEGDTVVRRASALARARGGVAAQGVTVVDDPRRGRGAWKTDDEGTECRPIPLIEAGRVSGCLHDLRSASLSGQRPTGHGRRASFREPVRPRMGCTFLTPGPLDPREIVEDTTRAIYVRRMDAATADPVSGTARFVVRESDDIARGRPGAPLAPFVLEVRTREVLTSLDAVGNDLAIDTCVGSCVRDGQPLATSVGAPTCRIGVATVVH